MLFFIYVLALSEDLSARRSYGQNTSFFFMSFSTIKYTDLTHHESTEDKIEESLALELGLRFFYNYNFLLVAGQDKGEGRRSFYGTGLKLNLPGFFFFGGSFKDLRRRSKKRWINTAVSTQLLYNKVKDPQAGEAPQFVETVFGLEFDAFVWGSLFLNFKVALHGREGDSYLGESLGLGYEF